ncbi:hypothetical protein Bmeg_06015 [Bacillus megaterium]|nr:hypothetical protein [Priestia megaterium]
MYFIWSNTLVTPAIPAADSKCPILDLTDPIEQYCLSVVYCLKAFIAPLISIGSPREVPVPCASNKVIDLGFISALSNVSTNKLA